MVGVRAEVRGRAMEGGVDGGTDLFWSDYSGCDERMSFLSLQY